METSNGVKKYFVIYADYGKVCGWLRCEKDGKIWEEDNLGFDATLDIDDINVDKSLLEEINNWQQYFEKQSFYDEKMDWNAFNKTGEQLTERLKPFIIHLFDSVIHEPPFEYYEYLERKKS